MLLLDYTGSGCEYAESALALARLGGLAGLEEGTQELRPWFTYDIASVNTGLCNAKTRSGSNTLLGVLPSELGNSVANLISDLGVLLALETLQELLADGVTLRLGQSEEQLLGLLGSGVLAAPRSNAPEQH